MTGTPSMTRSWGTVRPAVHYAAHTTRLTVRNWPYLVFTLAIPTIMYLVFNGLWGSAPVGPGVRYTAVIMVQMAGYGGLGAAMSGGAVLALERRSGWFRQLMVTSLPPRAFLAARTATVLALVLPALLLVYGCGFLVGGVRAPLGEWLASVLLIWVALVPLGALGLVIGVWVRGEAVHGVNTLVMLVLSMAGGLLFPTEMMPESVQGLAQLLPSYWVVALGRWPFLRGPFPAVGLGLLAVWTAVLVAVGALGYRRAAAASQR